MLHCSSFFSFKKLSLHELVVNGNNLNIHYTVDPLYLKLTRASSQTVLDTVMLQIFRRSLYLLESTK